MRNKKGGNDVLIFNDCAGRVFNDCGLKGRAWGGYRFKESVHIVSQLKKERGEWLFHHPNYGSSIEEEGNGDSKNQRTIQLSIPYDLCFDRSGFEI